MKQKLVESKKWFNSKLAEKGVRALKQNNIDALIVENENDACQKIINLIPAGSKIGYGRSLTLEQIGIKKILSNGGYNFIDFLKPGLSEIEKERLCKKSLLADVFLMSTNALSLDGHLVNIDGRGNRVAALIYGPSRVIIVAGINKIVADDQTAINRIKNYVAPIHARRRNKHVPCATVGECVNCHAHDRSCNALVIIEHQYFKYKDRIKVIIVKKELGL